MSCNDCYRIHDRYNGCHTCDCKFGPYHGKYPFGVFYRSHCILITSLDIYINVYILMCEKDVNVGLVRLIEAGKRMLTTMAEWNCFRCFRRYIKVWRVPYAAEYLISTTYVIRVTLIYGPTLMQYTYWSVFTRYTFYLSRIMVKFPFVR